MSCQRYVGAIVDHACGAEIGQEARQHLDACAPCRALFDRQHRAIRMLDSELQQALAIEPSATFERAVRARIAQRSVSASHAIWWTALAAAAVAAIAIGVAAMRSSERMTVVAPVEVARSTQSPQPAPKIDPHPRQTPGNVPDQAGPTPKQGKNPRTTPLPKPAESSLPEVDVIVAADQAAAVERYMALLRSGTLDTSSLARPDAGEPSELVVAPLEVQPLTVSEVEIRNSSMVDRRGPHENATEE